MLYRLQGHYQQAWGRVSGGPACSGLTWPPTPTPPRTALRLPLQGELDSESSGQGSQALGAEPAGASSAQTWE